MRSLPIGGEDRAKQEALVRLVHGNYPATLRAAALKRVAEVARESVDLEQLVLRDPDAEMRRAAVAVLVPETVRASSGVESAGVARYEQVRALVRRVIAGDPSPQVREEALAILGVVGIRDDLTLLETIAQQGPTEAEKGRARLSLNRIRERVE